MKQTKKGELFPLSSATINQAIGAPPSRKAKKRAAKAERGIERDAMRNMDFDVDYLFHAGMEDIGDK